MKTAINSFQRMEMPIHITILIIVQLYFMYISLSNLSINPHSTLHTLYTSHQFNWKWYKTEYLSWIRNWARFSLFFHSIARLLNIRLCTLLKEIFSAVNMRADSRQSNIARFHQRMADKCRKYMITLTFSDRHYERMIYVSFFLSHTIQIDWQTMIICAEKNVCTPCTGLLINFNSPKWAHRTRCEYIFKFVSGERERNVERIEISTAFVLQIEYSRLFNYFRLYIYICANVQWNTT